MIVSAVFELARYNLCFFYHKLCQNNTTSNVSGRITKSLTDNMHAANHWQLKYNDVANIVVHTKVQPRTSQIMLCTLY